jgi:hypothetical protein
MTDPKTPPKRQPASSLAAGAHPVATGSGSFKTPRAHPRTAIRLSAEVDTLSDRFTAATRDLSLGGAGLDLDRPLAEGATISVSLFLVVDDVEDEATAPVAVRAKVAWCSESNEVGRFTAGIRFDALRRQERDWLARFLGGLAT